MSLAEANSQSTADDSAEQESVAAVIVTYNRLEKLPQTLSSVQEQDYPCRWIVIVDNASTDGTAEYLDALDDPRLVIRHLRENRGGAGGFEYGMALGYELGADHVWVMDDDCYPAPNALGLLVSQRAEVADSLQAPVPFACSLVKAVDGTLCEMNNPITTWDWPRAYLAGYNSMRIVECTFVSVLFPRYVLAEAGLPLAEYFIWFDDKEYTKRLTARYAPGIIVMDSIVVHDMGVNAGVNYRQVNESNLWKFASGARNQGSYRWHYEGKWSYLDYRRRIRAQMREGGVSQTVQKEMERALRDAISFSPIPKFPSEMSEDLQLEAGSIATAPPAAILPSPAAPFPNSSTVATEPKRRGRIASILHNMKRRPVDPQQLHRLQVRINLLEAELDELNQQKHEVETVVEELEEQLGDLGKQSR